jgi:hypothetical protein
MSLGRVVLDACVLANFSLCDTLLRLAEDPPLYEAGRLIPEEPDLAVSG